MANFWLKERIGKKDGADMIIKTWNIESMTGYKPRTTFYEDFSIADHFGGPAIRDTYCRAFNAWQNNI